MGAHRCRAHPRRIPHNRPSASYRLHHSMHRYSHATLTATQVFLAALSCGVVGIVFGLDRPDWAIVSALLILQWGPDRLPGTIRGLHRLLGSIVSTGLFAAFHAFELGPGDCSWCWRSASSMQRSSWCATRFSRSSSPLRWRCRSGRRSSLGQRRYCCRLPSLWPCCGCGHGRPSPALPPARGGSVCQGDGCAVRFPADEDARRVTAGASGPAVRAHQRAPCRAVAGPGISGGCRGALGASPGPGAQPRGDRGPVRTRA